MRYVVVIDEPEDYETWLGEQKAFASQNPDIVAKFQKAAEQKAATKMEASAEVQ
jgi:cytochrome c oxidase subunit 2